MGWKDAIDYLRSGAKRRGVESDAPQPEDRSLPLAARIGSVVDLQASPLLRASANGSWSRCRKRRTAGSSLFPSSS